MDNSYAADWMLCYCPQCRQKRWGDQMSRILQDANPPLVVTVRLWPPRLPFEWPTTQKAICQ
ncbi:hypothetical protein [Rhodococcus sp. B10]|uniref:hypothetical protein n=1 Tax=Rhodococcus sp. B10 TaxID=2695876 RepID=UPI001431074F|nr:hypothetical protein [Rhodococcus sp. B10]NIL77628.1 hypothetical protein [Rhodococcus sp. B10]